MIIINFINNDENGCVYLSKWVLIMLIQLVVSLVLLLVGSSQVEAAQCAQDLRSPCVFTCNGTQFNLTDVFDFP